MCVSVRWLFLVAILLIHESKCASLRTKSLQTREERETVFVMRQVNWRLRMRKLFRNLWSGREPVTTTEEPVLVVDKAEPTPSVDPCALTSAIPRKTKGTNVPLLLPARDMVQCVYSITMNRGQALYTLHNLFYGVTETYSFTDIVTDSRQSVERNNCGYQIHPVHSDIATQIKVRLAQFMEEMAEDGDDIEPFMREQMTAWSFHEMLMTKFNDLNDAHTYYQSPFTMFRMYVPVNFGSRMSEDGTVQTVYVRCSSDQRTPLGELAQAHRAIYGELPVPDEHCGKTVRYINHRPALEFLSTQVSSRGPLTGRYQQLAQRLNANIFNSEVIMIPLSRQTLPQRTWWTLDFEDGSRADFNLVAVFTGDHSLRNAESLGRYMHSNTAFRAFVDEGDTFEKQVANIASSDGGMSAHLVEDMEQPVFDFEFATEADPRDWAKRASRGLGIQAKSPSIGGFTRSGILLHRVVDGVMVVQVASLSPTPRWVGDKDYMLLPSFVDVQKTAMENGVTRLLLDVSGNPGGLVASAHALLWYTMIDKTKICAPVRKRLTINWVRWIESFGDGFEHLVDTHMSESEVLANRETIFTELVRLISLVYDGMGFSQEQLGYVDRADAIGRILAANKTFEAISTGAEKAAAIVQYIRNREFLPNEFLIKDTLLPSQWFCPFDPNELTNTSPVPELKEWGTRAALYTKPAFFAECNSVIEKMPSIAPDYDHKHWTEIAFLSDGTCGSACALLTQALQTNGEAVAFTYGGLANEPLDVASFAGGNVEDYDSFWPSVAFGAMAGRLASSGKTVWDKADKEYWVSYPIPFPTKAKASFNWNMMFVEAMGEEALPRQFYLIPGRKHFNVWGRDEDAVMGLYREIASIEAWGSIPGQFAATHGQCPLEREPFVNRRH